MYKLKLVLVGPTESGKSTLANFISDATETPITETYRPTHCVRILEFEATNLNVNNRYVKADVELWDVSGNPAFEPTWPALQRDAHGVVFVFNPDKEHHARELDAFHTEFVEKPGMSDTQCVVFAYFRDGRQENRGVKLSNHFNRIPQLEVNIDEEGNRLRSDFNTFISSILANLSERNEQEEMNIMSGKN
ncbi:hypothetical protein TCAL_16434 [Tigriopus californicus]|uniref:Intraflagellar transport protein 22 homolog n=1 Tax=Tigriopus californicus TaxID=6832 RepID=A0A553P0C4_TIGCA|nr:intraflagellar transport protein 22 homolog [Tigriopus californicus]TRY71141.1 hypothetical protein TCAL_16434 [Tigriopus californicus]